MAVVVVSIQPAAGDLPAGEEGAALALSIFQTEIDRVMAMIGANTVGELDTNVDPACTLRVVDALVKANREFDFLMLPGLGHGAGESPFAARRRARMFVDTLGGPK